MVPAKTNPAVFLTLFLLCRVCSAQEVKFVDLTNLHPRTALRFQPGVPLCSPEQKPCIVNGFGGEIIDNDKFPNPNDPHILSILLDRISTTKLTLDPFEMELLVVNTGSAPMDVPAWGDLSDLQPADPWQAFNYLSLSILVSLSRPLDAGNYGMTGASMYGSTERPETVVSLKPGQWIRVKATMQLGGYGRVTYPVVNAELSPSFWLQRNKFTPKPGGGFFQMTSLHPREGFNYFPPIVVNFSPTTHTAKRP